MPKTLSDYQMMAYAADLYYEVRKVYEDIKFGSIKGTPVLIMEEGRFVGMSAIMVLENLKDEIEFFNEELE